MTRVKDEALLAAVDEELDRLRLIRTLLTGMDVQNTQSHFLVRTRKRVLSEEARQRIVDAQKRRWAAQKAETVQSF